MRRRTASLLAMLVLCVASAQGQSYAAGKLTQQIAQGKFSYALYLPRGFDERQQWPVVFVLDPAARGSVAAEQFVEAADRYGYIVAASNDSRNGPVRIDAVRAMWEDVSQRLSVDRRRFYVAGMSGGARAAILLADRCKDCFAGVLACAAGFGGTVPNVGKFSILFAAGKQDFNYPEIYESNEAAGKAHARHRLETFEGGHGWPPPDVLMAALRWFRLQEMRQGTLAKDEKFVESAWGEETEAAKQRERNGDKYGAFLGYEQLAGDFEGLRDVSEARKQAETLKSTSEVKDGAKRERSQFAMQSAAQEAALRLIGEIAKGEAGADAVARVESEAKKKIVSITRERNDDRATALERALGNIRANAVEESMAARRRGEFRKGRMLQEAAVATEPESAVMIYNLGCAFALEGDRKGALKSLKRAVAAGFKDVETLKSDRDLDVLRGEAEFQRLVAELDQSSR